MTGAIILAAGFGERYGKLKQFETVRKRQILDYTIDIYEPLASKMVAVLPPHYTTSRCKSVEGGKTRFESMRAGYPEVADCDKILVIDGVRCNTSFRIVTDLLHALEDHDVAYPCLRAVHTVALHDIAIDKENTVDIQTPEAVRGIVLKDIIENWHDEGFSVLYMAQKLGWNKVAHIEGDYRNIKITYPYDAYIFDWLLGITQHELPCG